MLLFACAQKSGLQIGFFTHFVFDTGRIYVVLGVFTNRPSTTHITATMTILPAEICSEIVDRNNVHLIEVTEKLARNFIHKT
jgi:hypothetical protein